MAVKRHKGPPLVKNFLLFNNHALFSSPCHGSSCPDGCDSSCDHPSCSVVEMEITSIGKIRGRRDSEIPSIINFYGVPFGREPVRFKAPVMDFYPKNITIDATKRAKNCGETGLSQFFFLFLNIIFLFRKLSESEHLCPRRSFAIRSI